jgi:hypothetical protein
MAKQFHGWKWSAITALVVTVVCVVTVACVQSPVLPSHTVEWPTGLTATPSTGTPATTRAGALTPASGYVEQEYFFKGSARRFTPTGDWGADGHWGVQPSQGTETFGTRLLVRRPIDPQRFNGIVVVEWLNTTTGVDLDAGWLLTRKELMREGYAWVGVSAQPEGLDGIKRADPARYAGAHIDSNDLPWDIFSQAGLALKAEQASLLGSRRPLTLLAMGYSQSAVWLNTYINAIAPLSKVYQGFLLHGGAPMAVWTDTSKGVYLNPKLRADLSAPVLQVQTEMEVMVSWMLSKTPDTDLHRYWEVTGAAHMHDMVQAQLKAIAPASLLGGEQSCIKPVNNLPMERVDQAALHALRLWVTEGKLPPTAPRLVRNGLGFVKNDDDGNALGGLRLPEIDAPTAHYGMYTNVTNSALSVKHMYLCVVGGDQQRFSAKQLKAHYADHAAYVDRYRAAADALVAQGLLRPADRDEGLAQAQAAEVP